jgi:hypothetical protein
MAPFRCLVLLLVVALLGCGGRPGGGSPDDGAVPRDGTGPEDGPANPPGCPSPAPADGAACNNNGTFTCSYPLPGPCPGAVDVCRCMNGSWACQVSLLDGGTCGLTDAGADGSLPAFCTGQFPRMLANGNESNPGVSGTVLPLNCCDAAEFVVVTQTVPMELVPIVVSWRAQVGPGTGLPATIDLANPPQGWAVTVDVGCDPNQSHCVPPDSYDSGFTGTLQVSRTSAGGYDMTLCLAVAESAGEPHPLLHALELYAPNITASY